MTASPTLDDWKAQLSRGGKEALLDLFERNASFGNHSAAGPADVLASILGAESCDSDIYRSFDLSCLSLAQEFRGSLLRLRQDSYEFRCQRANLTTLVLIIKQLLPRATVIDFHRGHDSWRAFFENFVVDRGLDLRREYLHILARSQNIAAEDGLEPRRLLPLWLSVCEYSGDTGRYDISCLRVALLGLRRLPLGEEFASNEDFALQGLAIWAAVQRPVVSAFEMEWRILQADYPRSPEFWKVRVEYAVAEAEREIFERTGGEETTYPLAEWWRRDVGIDPGQPLPAHGKIRAEPVPMSEWKPVVKSAGKPLEEALKNDSVP